MYGYIYETTNLVNGKKYIGQHKGKFNANYHGSGINIRKAIEKYSENKFKTVLIEQCNTSEELDKREIYWIDKYRKDYGEDKVYNIADGGSVNRSMSGKRNPMHHSNYTFTQEHRRHLSEALKGKSSWIKGKHWSIEQKKKLSESAKNRKVLPTLGRISINKR